MRKFLMVTVIAAGSAIGFMGNADAAPVTGMIAAPISTTLAAGTLAAPQDAVVESVQYRCGPRCQRHRAMRRHRRHY